MRHFDRNKILNNHQHGFRAKRSCKNQRITTIQKIASSMTRKGQVDVILFDLANAFDKVPHRRLRDYTLRWTESFLSQRKQSVLLEGTRSSERYSRVFHRARSKLFLAFINDLPESTKHSDARVVRQLDPF